MRRSAALDVSRQVLGRRRSPDRIWTGAPVKALRRLDDRGRLARPNDRVARTRLATGSCLLSRFNPRQNYRLIPRRPGDKSFWGYCREDFDQRGPFCAEAPQLHCKQGSWPWRNPDVPQIEPPSAVTSDGAPPPKRWRRRACSPRILTVFSSAGCFADCSRTMSYHCHPYRDRPHGGGRRYQIPHPRAAAGGLVLLS